MRPAAIQLLQVQLCGSGSEPAPLIRKGQHGCRVEHGGLEVFLVIALWRRLMAQRQHTGMQGRCKSCVTQARGGQLVAGRAG